MTDDQIKEMANKKMPKPLHFPTVMGAVVLSYNIPGVTASLKLPGSPGYTHWSVRPAAARG